MLSNRVENCLQEEWAEHVSPEAIALFKMFSRFEYSLKKRGYLQVRAHNPAAEANWDSFVNQALDADFFEEVRGIAPTIMTEPPKKQVRSEEGGLDWVKVAPPENLQELFGAVRRVRNNLFHGGKFVEGSPQRDKCLIMEAVEVLAYALEKCPDLRREFAPYP